MNRGVKPRRRATSLTARPVTTASGRRPARRSSRCETASVTRAWSGRATMAASVPSKSNASSGCARNAACMACLPSSPNTCFMSGDLVTLHPGLDALAQTQPARIGQHATGPAIDIELAHRHAQTRHALALLGLGHGERALQRRGAFLDVVRIDDQSLGHLAGRAGETARDDERGVLLLSRFAAE